MTAGLWSTSQCVHVEEPVRLIGQCSINETAQMFTMENLCLTMPRCYVDGKFSCTAGHQLCPGV